MQFMKNFAAFCFTEQILTGKVKKQHNEIEGKNTIGYVIRQHLWLKFCQRSRELEFLKKIQKKYNAIWVFWSEFLEQMARTIQSFPTKIPIALRINIFEIDS